MKKAKFILSAAGLLSIVAGAVAFKAQNRFSGTRVCYTSKKAGAISYGAIYTTTNGAHATLFCTLTAAPNPAAAALTSVTVEP